MKIVYLANSKLPSRTASSIQVMQMCQSLSNLGHQITLFAMHGDYSTQNGYSNDYNYYGVKECFEIQKLNWPKYSIGHTKNIFLLGSFLFRESKNIDIVYGRSIQGVLLASSFKLPIIYEIHTPPSTRIRYLAERILFRSKSIQQLVFISESLRRKYQEVFPLELSKLKSIVAHDGAAHSPYSCTQKSQNLFQSNKFLAGYFGSLYPGKGVEIIAKIAPFTESWDFHIFGGTEQEFELLCNSKCPKNVICHGYFPPNEITSYQAQMDALLLPAQKRTTVLGKGNISEWMSPLKLFEYMAVGKPIIASDLDVLREVLIDGINSILVTPDNVDKWLIALKKIEENSVFAKQLGTNAKECLINEYSWDQRASKVLNTV
jgi:glycosyltransferase involved in cell wall biosynthesis